MHYEFHGGNKEAFESHEREILLAGAAGTGKSVCLALKLLQIMKRYPGSRGLFARDTRTSLTQSGLVTLEDILIEDGYEKMVRSTTRRVRQSYVFPNGSEIVVAGLDDPGKTLSSEYDACFVQEATEGVSLATYETLLRCLRRGRWVRGGQIYHQIMMDCNPTTPTHWLYKRTGSGTNTGPLRLYTSTHKDNPAFWDHVKGDYTPAGHDYVEKTLSRMSGARRNRFYHGIWAAAEGLVYDAYRPDVHNLPNGWRPPADWQRVWGIDWGFSNPCCLVMAAMDADYRLHFYKEFYATGKRVEELAAWAKAEVTSGREPLPVMTVCDHDPEAMATFQLRGPLGLPMQLADKGDKTGGIEIMQERFDLRADGKPGIYFVPDARANPVDRTLEDAGKPTCGLEELVGYIWDTRNPDRLKDEPLDVNNHAMDASRYICKYVDAFGRQAVPMKPVKKKSPFGRLPSYTWRN